MVSMRLLSPANRARFNALTRDQRREFREFADGERTSPDIEEAHDLLNAHFDRWMSVHHPEHASEASSSPSSKPPSHAVGGYVRHHQERQDNSAIVRMAH